MAASSSTTKIFLLKSGCLLNEPRLLSNDVLIEFGDRAIIEGTVSFGRLQCIELISECRRRQRHLHRTRRIERRPQVLAKEIEGEASFKRTCKPRFRQPLLE